MWRTSPGEDTASLRAWIARHLRTFNTSAVEEICHANGSILWTGGKVARREGPNTIADPGGIRAHLRCPGSRDGRRDHGDGHRRTGRAKLAASPTAKSGRSPTDPE